MWKALKIKAQRDRRARLARAEVVDFETSSPDTAV
jgi:hypothetical protein